MSGIKIDGQTFSVKLTTEPIGGEDGERSFIGQSDEATNTIVIDGTMPESRQEEVLLHEIVHLAVSGLPEGLVRDLSVGMYGALRENGLLIEGMIALVSDGDVTPEDMARLNKESNKQAEKPVMMGMFRVSEQSWDAPAFNEGGGLTVVEPSGAVNRMAAHLAAAQLQGARGGVTMAAGRKRMIARQLAGIYRDTLKEPLPKALVEMGR